MYVYIYICIYVYVYVYMNLYIGVYIYRVNPNPKPLNPTPATRSTCFVVASSHSPPAVFRRPARDHRSCPRSAPSGGGLLCRRAGPFDRGRVRQQRPTAAPGVPPPLFRAGGALQRADTC